jgi:hypothetical protein
MELKTITEITPENALQVMELIIKRNTKTVKYGKKTLKIEDILKQYNPNEHDVHDEEIRKDKWIEVPAPGWTESNRVTMPEKVATNRSSIPMQRLIVSRAVAFLTGNPMAFEADPIGDKEKVMLAAVKRVMDNNKMDYLNAEIAEKMKSETHCALLWYVVDNSGDPDAEDDFEGIPINTQGLTLRCRLLAKSLGDDIYPIYDRNGSMIGFLRIWNELTDDETKIKNYELYCDKINIFIQELAGTTVPTVNTKANMVGKGQVMYFSQAEPEWLPVQPNITRSETIVSNTGNTNDRYAEPTVIVSGEIEGYSKAGESGKLLEVGKDASVSLMEAKNGVESVKFEYDTQKSIQLEGSQTPDISFESMKSLGVFSGTAIKLLFWDASLKVKNALPTYGKSQQRSINFVKAALAKFDISFKQAARMVIKPKIEAYMPSNVAEAIDMLSVATGNKAIMSQETATRLNPLVQDPETEITKVKADNEAQVGAGFAA